MEHHHISWPTLRVQSQAVLRFGQDICRTADKRTLSQSHFCIHPTAVRQNFQGGGSKRATVAAWDALAPEIRRANSRPSKTTSVLKLLMEEVFLCRHCCSWPLEISEMKAWIASPLAGKFALIGRQRANLGQRCMVQRFYWKEVVDSNDSTCAVLSTQPADVSSSRWACILQSGHKR